MKTSVCFRRVAMFAFAALFAGGAWAELPPLYGDGAHDDTAAIQARLDSGASLVYLPPPEKEYLISKTLVIRSRTELKLDRFTRVRLAPNANCTMLSNADWEKGDRDIAIAGGVWDMDNLRQAPNPWVRADGSFISYDGKPPYLFRFHRIDRFSLRGVTFRNPVTYNCHLAGVTHFTVDDVTFEQTAWNPVPINMDGINLLGGCHHGRISNLRGYCSDDMVAINACGSPDSPFWQPITDIDVDGLYSDFTHRGVRILSIGPKVERITVRNVHVRTYRDAVALTTEGGKGTFDEIVIRDVMSSATYEPEALYNSKAAWPIVHVDGGCDVGHLVIDNLCRTETCRAAHPTIGVSSGAKIEHLVIRDCRQVNETKDDMTFLTVHGKARIGKLELGDVSFASAPGAGRNVLRDDYAPCAGIFYTYAPNVRPATDVYLLLGRLDPVERGVPVERVRTFKDGKAWYEVKNPTFEKEDTPAARACRAFGRKLAAADPKAVIGFVPVAESNAVERVRKALERGGKLKGVLCLRGETDDSRLTATAAALRKEFGDVSVIKQVLE